MAFQWKRENVFMKHSITYVLVKRNNRPGEVRVRMRVGKLATFNIPYTVNPDKWNKGTNRCNANTTHGKDKVSAYIINSEIQRYEDAATKLLVNDLSPDEFRESFNNIIKGEKKKSNPFFETFDKYIKEQGKKKGWVKKNYEKNEVVKTHLKKFNPDLSFNLTSKDIDNFIYFLNSKEARMNVKKPKTGLKNSTSERYVSMLKWFLTWAKKEGYYSGDLNTEYSINLKQVEKKAKVFFTWDELMEWYTFDFGTDSYNQVRDCVSLMSFTSLRHSDLSTLKKQDVFKDHIIVYTEKTDDGLRIDLNNYSRAILDKYKHVTFANDLAMPVISNQKMNDYLKEMGKIIKFTEPVKVVYYIGSVRHDETYPKHELLSTHVGRRTFIVNAIYLGIEPVVVMKWTGHKDYNSMKPYIAIVDELKNREMDKFNKVPPTKNVVLKT